VSETDVWKGALVGGAKRWVYLFALLSSMHLVPDKAIDYFALNLLDWMLVTEAEFGMHVFPIQNVVCIK